MSKKKTTNEFINDAKLVHFDKNDYDMTIYQGNKIKVWIYCYKCQDYFHQRPNDHLKGNNCPNCAHNKKKTQEQFIEESKQIKKHIGKYGYDKVDYIDIKTPVLIYCKKCQDYFKQTPTLHLTGRGCKKCAGTLTKTNEQFIFDSQQVLNNIDKYGYDKINYINNRTPIEIYCKSCQEYFIQSPKDHLDGCGCKKCAGKYLDNVMFIIKANIKHNNKYTYPDQYIKNNEDIIIICPIHGGFKQSPNNHLNGAGCPTCKESKGERDIRNYLNINEIKFVIQKKFKNCKDKKTLPFDFYLPELNMCIEFDGRQHYEMIERWGGEEGLIDRQKKDLIKTNYCLENNIDLLRIKYDENIEEKLSIYLKQKKVI